MGLGRVTSFYLLTPICIQPTNKLVSSPFGTPLVLGQATCDFGLTKLTMAQTRGKPPPSPIQYSLCLSMAPTSEWFFIPGLPRRSPETVLVWTFATLQDYNFLFKPLIGMRSEANLQFSCQKLSNDVSHFAYTHRGRVNSQLLVMMKINGVKFPPRSKFLNI